MVTSGSRLTRRLNKRTHLVKKNVHHQLINTIFFLNSRLWWLLFFTCFQVCWSVRRADWSSDGARGMRTSMAASMRWDLLPIDSCIVYCYWNSCNRNIHASLTVSNFISDCFFYALLGHKCVTVVFLVIVAESTSKRPLWLIA